MQSRFSIYLEPRFTKLSQIDLWDVERCPFSEFRLDKVEDSEVEQDVDQNIVDSLFIIDLNREGEWELAVENFTYPFENYLVYMSAKNSYKWS